MEVAWSPVRVEVVTGVNRVPLYLWGHRAGQDGRALKTRGHGRLDSAFLCEALEGGTGQAQTLGGGAGAVVGGVQQGLCPAPRALSWAPLPSLGLSALLPSQMTLRPRPTF